jgi:hypothetical protein
VTQSVRSMADLVVLNNASGAPRASRSKFTNCSLRFMAGFTVGFDTFDLKETKALQEGLTRNALLATGGPLPDQPFDQL